MEPFKNFLDAAAVRRIGNAILRADPAFDTRAFLRNIERALEPLELKQRVVLVSSRLREVLPDDPRKSFPLLVEALKQGDRDPIGVSGFLVWPLTRFVAERGLGHFDVAMRSLHAMTQVFTAEFDIRPYLIHHEARTIRQLHTWIHDPINDHSKQHGDWVVQQLTQWRDQGNRDPELEWIIRHATRTLVKRGHPGALGFHGVSTTSVTLVRTKLLTRRIALGQSLRVEVVLRNPSSTAVTAIVDHQIRFLKANGSHAPKIFKGKKITIEAGDLVTLTLQIPIRPVTVRRYYPGVQWWAPVVNGIVATSERFTLDVP